MWNIEEIADIENLQNMCVDKIIDNINATNTFIASPSNEDPDYVYHWTRDAALFMRVIIDKYKKTADSRYFQILIKYVNCEYELQNLDTISGLGGKIQCKQDSLYGKGGRPQNDGPALRGLIMLQLIPYLQVIIAHL